MAEKFYCKWCGTSYPSVSSLTASSCLRNPEGKKHELYEGSEKSQYTCKYCGTKYPSLSSLTASSCSKSPHKKHHPAM
jgi:redox-regulated HSP33 family molecular chaperone